MTHGELVRRVFAARHTLAASGGGTNFNTWRVYVSRDDLRDIKRTFEMGWGPWSTNSEPQVFGMPLQADDGLRPGEVRLRAEVAV